MPQEHQIENLIIKRGLSRSSDILMVGTVWDNGRISWGDCAQLKDIPAVIQLLQERITPILQKRPGLDFLELVEQIDRFRETTIETRLVSPPAEDPLNNVSPTVSRRRLITGFIAEETPETEQFEVARPLPAAVRFGLSQALLLGMAANQQKSVVQYLAAVFRTPELASSLPLMVDVAKTDIAIIEPVIRQAADSVVYNLESANLAETLGPSAERLQAHVRKVKAWLTDIVPTVQPVIHLNIQGGFTELYDNDAGKILGALYGLEQAAKPYPVVVENCIKGEISAVSASMKQIQSYLGFRKMSLKMAAGFSLFSPSALKRFVSEAAVHQVHLDLSQFGSISQTMTFITDCHERGIEVILHDGGGNVPTATAVALTAGAFALSGPSHLFYNESIKVLARSN